MNDNNKEQFWQFSVIPSIEESTFNKVLERFYDLGISGLVRENIQNSLDGKFPEIDEPVKVKINIGKVSKNDIPGLDEIKARISCLEGRNSYTKETISHMNKKMNQDEINYISFEDSNTKGLRGAKNGQSDSKEDTWSIYAYNKGVHSEEKNSELEKLRGGSHGIGKIASNAASELHMMFFANCDEHYNKHLGGTIQLIEHKYNELHYRSTGYFTKIKYLSDKVSKFYPFENKYSEIFSKDTRGLKIIIPFLRDQFNNEKEVIRSVCDSFFVAIIENKLEVVINDKKITRETISEYICNPEYYNQNISEIKEAFTPIYFSTYKNIKPINIKIGDKKQNHSFKLYFNYDENISKGRVAVIRTIGMKIEDKKVKGNVNKPFNAILIPESITEDAFLKSLENESHTQLSYEHIKDQELQSNAKRFINNMSKEISKILEQSIKANNPTDGIMNTGDLIYELESQFKKDLSKSMSTVTLNQGTNTPTVVKVSNDPSKSNKNKLVKDKKTKEKKERALKKVKKDNEEMQGKENKEDRYNASPDIVERIILSNDEILKIDLSYNKEIKKAKLCDIGMAVVDGMGQEYTNEFKLDENYELAIDAISGSKYNVTNNLIKDVKIDKGIVQVKLKLKSNFNRALKFVYYVEV